MPVLKPMLAVGVVVHHDRMIGSFVVASWSPWPPLGAAISGTFERGANGKTWMPADA
jgi:hypothetical protein